MQKYIGICASILSTLVLNTTAQTRITNNCGTKAPMQQWDEAFNKRVQEFSSKYQTAKTSSGPITIPVIVHVLHSGQPVGTFPNLAQGQINSEIMVLNQDFAGNSPNITNLPLVFDSLKSNTGISFCLAQLDPAGATLPEPGIDRVDVATITSTAYAGPVNPTNYLTDNNLTNYLENFVKPNTIWNTNEYFNIWISDKSTAVGMLAYSTFPAITGTTLPGLPTGILGSSNNDGVWSYAKSFGSQDIFPTGVYYLNYNKGNIVTHEVGHWLGLRHIWGDGNCATDYCNDTPPAQTSNSGYPIHPYNLGVCAGNTTGEMFYNYMDYSIDSCLTLFTKDQNIRMQTALAYAPYRNQLAQSSVTLCFPTPVVPIASFTVPSSVCTNTNIPVNNSTIGNPLAPIPISYIWSSIPSTGTSFIPNNSVATPSISIAFPGTYFIFVVATNSVGSNSTMQSITANSCATTGLNQNSQSSNTILLFPNPCNEFINLEIENFENPFLFQLYSVSGGLLQTYQVTKPNEKINLAELARGLYIYKISDIQDKTVKYGKVAKQ